MNDQVSTQLINVLNNVNINLNNIAESVKSLSSDHWVAIGSLANIFVGIVAIYASNSRLLNSFLLKAKLQIDNNIINSTQNNIIISRLTIKNLSINIAKNVTLVVDELSYYKEKNGQRLQTSSACR